MDCFVIQEILKLKKYIFTKKILKGLALKLFQNQTAKNTPLQKLFDSWVWFRGKSSNYTVIASDLHTSTKRGGYNIPILYIANKNEVVVNRFGFDGLFTKYSNKIEHLFAS